MGKRKYWVSSLLLGLLLVGIGIIVYFLAGPGFQREGMSSRPVGNSSIQKVDVNPASNQTYKKTCGECHFPYPPALLPAPSWDQILNRMDDHFGEKVSIVPANKESIRKYLMENGADRSSSKKSIKIINSLNGQIPLRITQIPYIQKKHRGLTPDILNRKAIGSLSNCIACHQAAEAGDFNDERVVIPQ